MRPQAIFALIFGGAVLFLIVTKRWEKFTSALAGKNAPSDASAAGSAPIGGTIGTTGGQGGNFGLSGVAWSHIAPSQYWQDSAFGPAPDRGLVPDETGEWNYGLPAGVTEPFALPPGSTWTLKKDIAPENSGGVGGVEVWSNAAGAVLAFLHLSRIYPGAVGSQVQGGTAVGVTGWPLTSNYGAGTAGPSNAHLAVIYNQAGAQYI